MDQLSSFTVCLLDDGRSWMFAAVCISHTETREFLFHSLLWGLASMCLQTKKYLSLKLVSLCQNLA